ncbi:MAG: preprotein translocase subunit SecY [Candidatus Hydrogenedentes bacterium]|nr:preprotein translocase subunit SecY [Candidatus Hydrogenedentota bacterium]
MSQPVEAFRNAFKIPELKQRILFTIFILAVYRLGCHIPTPGVDGAALSKMIQNMTQSGGAGVLGFYDLFSGGALQNATVFALGIMPYISSSIILQLLTSVVPSLEKLAKEGAEGQKKITQYTRYGTVVLSVIQAIGIAAVLKGMNTPVVKIVPNPGIGFYAMCVISFTTGTAFIMWLGEQISERGIGNGMSLLIFAGIVSRMPHAVINLIRYVGARQMTTFEALIMVAMLVFVIAGIVLVTTGQRRIPVQYPRQVKGRKVYGGQRNYLPLRVNQAGVIPIIFASSILMLPSFMGSAVSNPTVQDFFNNWFNGYGVTYNVLYALLIIFFCFFYTAITFNPIEMADNMKKNGGVVMGVRPGKATAEYLNTVMVRITLVGSLFLAIVALLPHIVYAGLNLGDAEIAQFFGGTSLLILVGVALDTVKQIEQHLVMHHYDGFMKGRRIRGRR